MKAIDRIFQYIEYKGIKPTRFEKEYGLSNGYLSQQLKRNADIGETILNTIINNCQDLNSSWLITGEGEMLKPNSGKMSEPEAQYGPSESEKFWRELTASQQRTIESQARVIEEQSRVIASFSSKASNQAI